MEYGIINAVLNGEGEPKVGEGATILYVTDRYPATVIEVTPFKSGPNKGKPRKVIVQWDKAKVISGSTHDGSAVWQIEPDPNGTTREFTWRPKRGWDGVVFGCRERYEDPHY